MDESQQFVGKQVEQVRATLPECQKFVGRRGTVDDAFTDEKGQVHVRTEEDGMWCPASLISVIS